MKRAIAIILETILMLVVFFVGSILPEFHILPMWSVPVGTNHIFVLDGLLLMLVVDALIVLIGLARKRLFVTLTNSTLALLLALALGLAMKFGFKSV
jgi:hypothetical protein